MKAFITLPLVEKSTLQLVEEPVTSVLDSLVAEKQMKWKNELAIADNVSVTVDIWSDHRMTGILGVTAH